MTDYTPLAPPIATPIYREDGTISNVWNEYFVRYGLMINSAVDGVEIYGENVFKYSAGETIPDNTSITLTALLLGNLTVYDWEYYNGTVWTDFLSGTQDEITYVLTYDNVAWGSNTFLRVRCLSGTVYGETTILKVRDGVAGVDGGNWSSDINFVAADYNTVGWYAGSIFTAGVEFEIVQNLSGTGNMAAATASYIYLYPTVSETELQVTTSAVDAVGSGKILVCVAYPNASTSVKAQFQAFGGRGGVFINADNIAAGCITADKIVANALTSTQINTSTITVGDLSGGSTVVSNASTGATYGTGLINGTYSAYNTNRVNGTAASTVVSNASTGATHAGTTHAPSNADQTYTAINGGVISTGYIRNSANTMSINFGTATITVNTSDGLTISGSGGIVFETTGGDSTMQPYGSSVEFQGQNYMYYCDRLMVGYTSGNSTITINSLDSATPGLRSLYVGGSSGTYVAEFTGDVLVYGNILGFYSSSHSVGSSTKLWKDVWAVDGTINTSDEKDKKDIVDSDLGLDFVKELVPKKWIWNTGIRSHYGLVAQDVETVIQSKNIDFAGLIKNNLTKVRRDAEIISAEDDSKGRKPKEDVLIETKDIKPNDKILESYDSYGLRYTEFIGPMIKAIQELSNKVDTLTPTQTEKEI